MIIQELIDLLRKKDPKHLVIMSRDEEGNGYNEIYMLEDCIYQDGQSYIVALTEKTIAAGYTEEDMCPSPGGERAVCIWP